MYGCTYRVSAVNTVYTSTLHQLLFKWALLDLATSAQVPYVLPMDVCKSQEQPVDLPLPLNANSIADTVSQLANTGLMSFGSHVSVGGRDDQIDEHMIVTQDNKLQVFLCKME